MRNGQIILSGCGHTRGSEITQVNREDKTSWGKVRDKTQVAGRRCQSSGFHDETDLLKQLTDTRSMKKRTLVPNEGIAPLEVLGAAPTQERRSDSGV